jgi:hypothetical protein
VGNKAFGLPVTALAREPKQANARKVLEGKNGDSSSTAIPAA